MPHPAKAAPRRPALLLLITLALLTAACARGTSDDSQVTVLAAASLVDAFTEMAEAFEAEHPEASVELRFDGSSRLAAQLAEGARADVFASANEMVMDQAAADGSVDDSAQVFATNDVAVALAPGNPANIGNLADLERSGLRVAGCAAPVPCGSAANDLLADRRLKVSLSSEEPSVTAVMTKVTSGEVDAGLVYRSEVRGLPPSERIIIDPAENITVRYPIAAAADADPANARRFIDFVLSTAGQLILADWGFGPAADDADLPPTTTSAPSNLPAAADLPPTPTGASNNLPAAADLPPTPAGASAAEVPPACSGASNNLPAAEVPPACSGASNNLPAAADLPPTPTGASAADLPPTPAGASNNLPAADIPPTPTGASNNLPAAAGGSGSVDR